MKDKDCRIGGYYIRLPIRDAPITYFDCEGNHIATFHIFGSDKEKKKAMEIIDSLRKRFPVEEKLVHK